MSEYTNTAYKIEINGKIGISVYGIEDAISSLYLYLINNQITDFSKIQLSCYFMGCKINYFQIRYQNGLVLYDDNSTLKIPSLFPEILILDKQYKKIIVPKVKTFNFVKNKASYLNPIGIHNEVDQIKNIQNSSSDEQKNRHIIMKERAKIAEQAKNEIKMKVEEEKKELGGFDENFEAKKENERNKKIETRRANEKISIFMSDKKSYTMICNDLKDGIIKIDDIPQFFVLKYEIFKILENRGVINFDTNDNIDDEYDIFKTLFEECSDCVDDPKYVPLGIYRDDEFSRKSSNKKIYIPHNYQYMTKEEKEKYAKKYKMTLSQFENKYINNTINDDEIDNFIKEGKLVKNSDIKMDTNISTTTTENISESDGESIGTDSEDSSDSFSIKPMNNSELMNILSNLKY